MNPQATPRTRIAHVSSAHRWSDNRVHLREAASLAAAGYDVTLIAIEHDVEVPETGVRVVTLRQRARFSRIFFGSIEAVLQALKSRAMILHLHDPELIWAIPLLRLAGRKVVYDAHEDLPSQVLDKHYLPGWGRKLASKVALLAVALAGRSNKVVAATETIAERYPLSKTHVVHNYPRLRDEDEAAPGLLSRGMNVGYVGAMSRERGTEEMVMALASSDFPEGWRATVAGSTAPASLLHELEILPGWSKVDYHGQVSPMAARDLLRECRVGLVTFRRNKAHLDSLPTKIFEYFAAGIPVIASDFPLWRKIVAERDAGLVVDETDPSAIAKAVQAYDRDPEMLVRHGENARRLARDLLNWRIEECALLALYADLVGSSTTNHE